MVNGIGSHNTKYYSSNYSNVSVNKYDVRCGILLRF